MSNFFTIQPRDFVSIYIAPTVDLTTTLKVGEKGVVASIGKIPYGNPLKPVILNTPSFDKKTTIVAQGGSQDNEALYHYEDFFSGFSGKLVVGRILGAGSTTKVLEVEKNGTAYELKQDTNLNVFGAGGLSDWSDTAVAEVMEIVIVSCMTDKHSIKITKDDNDIEIKLYDRNGNDIYSVSGGFAYDSTNDYGQSNFIGNMVDTSIIEVKTNPTHADAGGDFTIVETFANGLVTELGDKNYQNAVDTVSTKLEQADYFFTAGLSDVPTIKKIKTECFRAKCMLAIDLLGSNMTQAIAFKNSLAMNEEYVFFIYNEGKDVFRQGAMSIGLSGFFVGQTVKKNLSKLSGQGVENRLGYGIAGVDVVVPRTKKDELRTLTDDEMTLAVKERINVLRMIDGKLCIGDVLSGNPKNQATSIFPIVEAKFFLDRYIANIIMQKFFKNLEEAKRFVDAEVRRLFATANKQGYFNNDGGGIPFAATVDKKESDTIVVRYNYIPEGVLRKGEVYGTISNSIELEVG